MKHLVVFCIFFFVLVHPSFATQVPDANMTREEQLKKLEEMSDGMLCLNS